MTEHPLADRRTFLAALATAGTGALAGCSLFDRGSDAQTTEADPDLAESLATRFAPTLFFDIAEPWFPTDPRPYASDRDGETVVDGFDALDGYHERHAEAGEPPDPTVFYHAVEYEDSPLAVVQFWIYSAFDQFTTNFHWHDWEVLHVFVDRETDRPQLYVASSHSRRVPNNEFLDPDPEMVPRILSELGSHSSALSVNDEPDAFQRLPGADLLADITNSAIEGVEALSELPLAYGLPRDEGARLPYVVPEYEGAPVYEHDRLPNVERDSLVDEALTVRTFDSLASPPTDLPERSTGVVFSHEERVDDASTDSQNVDASATRYAYELVPTEELEHIVDFTGPQLSFEFAVPEFAEDAVAGHISTTGAPWGQPRYGNPAADITDPNHRAALAERYDAIGDAAAINTVVASVTEAVASDDAPDGEGLTTRDPTVEAVALLESEPTAVPTFDGVAVVRDVPDGEHRLTINAPGQAPHSEQLSVGSGERVPGDDATTAEPTSRGSSTAQSTDTETATAEGASAAAGDPDPSTPGQRVTLAGTDGEVPLVARENARKLEVDADGTDADLATLAIDDDFAGRLYDGALAGSAAVYVHRGGAYTAEVRDSDGAVGAFRVNPDPAADREGSDTPGPPIRIDRPDTGKASLSSFLASIASETSEEVAALLDGDESTSPDDALVGGENALRGLVRALDAVVDAAERAAASARAGERSNADRRLRAVSTALDRVTERIAEASDDVPGPLSNAVRNRVDEATRRAEQAQNATKL
ncbi:hypothetical protein [Halobellus captivus]|uniref:hypothetical protein n=1 Tax=Halobellus captivus TaxID=2592614 RepID=UPI001939FB5C|nr:hypothetical protein [Halobellus captivus]